MTTSRLFNRRFLEESLERELELASRKRQSVAVLFLDLDHFKRFNDTFGHHAGDMVPHSLADLFRTFFRATDICCRYGGEEFAIILPESSAQDAVKRADALRSEVKGLRLKYKKQTLGQLTLSAGVAAFPEHGSTSGELLKTADKGAAEDRQSCSCHARHGARQSINGNEVSTSRTGAGAPRLERHKKQSPSRTGIVMAHSTAQ